MVIFNSYVSLPEGIYRDIHLFSMIFYDNLLVASPFLVRWNMFFNPAALRTTLGSPASPSTRTTPQIPSAPPAAWFVGWFILCINTIYLYIHMSNIHMFYLSVCLSIYLILPYLILSYLTIYLSVYLSECNILTTNMGSVSKRSGLTRSGGAQHRVCLLKIGMFYRHPPGGEMLKICWK